MPLESLRSSIRQELDGLSYRRRQVTFLLGTDEHIHHERRVALTPRHVVLLLEDLRTVGLEPQVYVIAGAGARAGHGGQAPFADADYEAAGATVVTEQQATTLQVDILHALKEPTEYESLLRAPILRIGALHLASKPPGLCQMLQRKNFAAIIDGGTVGSCAYLKHGGDRTPIVGSMSRFAGSVSARKLVKGLKNNGIDQGKIVVVGGGIAGRSAIGQLVGVASPLVVVDPYAPTRVRLAEELPKQGFDRVEIVKELSEEAMDDAVGVIFAHRSGAKKAEKVCDYDRHIVKMRRQGGIADIAIDQGGSISHADYDERDDANTSLKKYQKLFAGDFYYYAETNMPREEPHDASESHGDSSLPYMLVLLGLCAHFGDPLAVSDHILERAVQKFDPSGDVQHLTLLESLVQDLRNGVQLAMRNGDVEITDHDISQDEELAGWVKECAG